MTSISAYLSFNNNCSEAMHFYRESLGGELIEIKVAESPEMAAMMPPEMGDSILHSSLQVGNTMIMASDLHRSELVDGNTVTLCINCESEDDLRRFFANLSEGGTIVDNINVMPGSEAMIGSLSDRYGKQWMFYFDKAGQMSKGDSIAEMNTVRK
jgi:PhnB protein